MINVLGDALKSSLMECNKIENPNDYARELLETINRYKTNMFKMLATDPNLVYDPKELVQIRICGSWRIRPGMNRKPQFLESSPFMLHVNGVIPAIGERKNRECSYNLGIDISNIIDVEKLNQLKTDWYSGVTQEIEDDETSAFDMPGVYMFGDRQATEVIDITLQFSARVYHTVVSEYERKSAERMASDPKLSNEVLRKRAEQKERAMETDLGGVFNRRVAVTKPQLSAAQMRR